MTVIERINALRDLMKMNNLQAYIVYHTDPHQSEYPISHYLEREWISGFTGSAGTLVVTEQLSGLWTDARYYLQAEKELAGSNITLFKASDLETPTIEEWLYKQLKNGDSVGANPKLITVIQKEQLAAKLEDKNIHFCQEYDLLSSLWIDNRPEVSLLPIEIHPEQWSGESVSSKLDRLRKELNNNNSEGIFISALDEIAWIFNIRGRDTRYNPVSVAFAFIGKEEAFLFTNRKKITPVLNSELEKHGVICKDEDYIFDFLKEKSSKHIIAYDRNKTNIQIEDSIKKSNRKHIISPISKFKSIKNKIEIEGFRKAATYEGVALSYLFKWIEEELEQNKTITELDVVHQLHKYRSLCPFFVDESFGTIAGYGDNGAIIHYNPAKESSAKLETKSFLLLDSGGQYNMGTTDITRTVHLGTPTKEEKKDFTMVLKANIQLNRVIFPNTARGVQLDALARKPLWEVGLDFPHGTGHGIGSFLNVHEGPQSIRNIDNGVSMEEGMVTSNEPGLYRVGKYGIRTENMILCRKYSTTEFGKFLYFETLSLFPLDTKSIELKLLLDEEIEWINNYHQMVFHHLAPRLDDETKHWLREKCACI